MHEPLIIFNLTSSFLLFWRFNSWSRPWWVLSRPIRLLIETRVLSLLRTLERELTMPRTMHWRGGGGTEVIRVEAIRGWKLQRWME
jgi:hypothetical protein